MAFISTTRNKIIVLVVLTILVFTGWQFGLEIAYSRILVGGANAALSVIKKDNSIGLEKENNTYQFRVRTVIEGRKASFPQAFGGLLQPFVIILSWQLFMFLAINKKQALWSAGINVGLFYLLQIIFLILLTGYHTSEIQQFVYVMMVDSFYIIALVLVIKDNMLFRVFYKK